MLGAESQRGRRAHQIWPNSAIPGQLSQDLPTPKHFEQAATIVTKEMVAETMSLGPDPDPIIESIQQAIDTGVDHVYLHQIGADQKAFCDMWCREIAPVVTNL